MLRYIRAVALGITVSTPTPYVFTSLNSRRLFVIADLRSSGYTFGALIYIRVLEVYESSLPADGTP
jgi:hypothetical protein